MIAWCYHDIGLGIFLLYAPTHVGDTGCRVSPTGFAEYVAFRQLWQLFLHDAYIAFVGHYPDVFGHDDVLESIYGEL